MNVMLVSFPHLPVCRNLMYIAYKNLKKLGVNVKTLGPEPIDGAVDNFENIVLNNSVESGMSIIGMLKMPLYVIRSVNIIRKNKPDVIHFLHKHIWNYPIILYCKRFLKNTKIVHSIHDPIGHEGDKVQNGVRLYNSKIVKVADGLVVHSKNAYNQLIENYCIGCKVFKVNLSINDAMPFKKKVLNKNLLFFGRVNKYKGCDMLPQLAEELYRLDNEIVINVMGRAADDIDQELIRKINECVNIKWDNRFFDDSEIDDVFDNISIVLIMYNHISQSGVICDAFNRSVPVVAFDIDGMREFVNEKNACLIKPFDIKKYAEAIVNLLNDNEKWNNMCYEAWKNGNKMYSGKSMAEGFVDLYNEV